MNIACFASETTKDDLPFLQHQFHFFNELTDLLYKLKSDFRFNMVVIDISATSWTSIKMWLTSRDDKTPVVLLYRYALASIAIAKLLDAGADDVIAMPVSGQEMNSRFNAVARRHADAITTTNIIAAHEFVLDKRKYEVYDRGVALDANKKEFEVAWLLFSNPGEFLSKEHIGTSIWNTKAEICSRTVEQHIYMIRKKLRLGRERGVYIRTAYQKGYKLEAV